MIDSALLPMQRSLMDPPARWLAARGVAADQVTVTGFAIGLLAVFAIAWGLWSVGLVLILLNRLCDGLDGALARRVGTTDRGAFLDIALDFAFYALVPVGVAFADPAANALPAAVLIAAFVGTGSSFLAFSTIAAQKGLTADAYPSKGIYYLGGLTEGFETIVFFILICLLPQYFAPMAYGFAAACALTTAIRWHQGWVAFGPQDTPHDKT
ncbi:CDP-alcohol phosphatidyltransferase family protein [Sagittula sp. SSi028]|uniref:CDP-alcohol phosphatidyltransferase family protein n=1 Tax=Sagittula sp. SSi028 TaxID=3400636 RepID=UPI003AF93B24